jgi:hypothetical protein
MYKKTAVIIITIVLTTGSLQSQVSINTDGSMPNASAMLDIKSTESGILIPRMSAAQRDAIPNPASGLLVFVSTDHAFYYYNGSLWTSFSIVGNPVYESESGEQYAYVIDSCGHDHLKKLNASAQEVFIGRADYILQYMQDTKYTHNANSKTDDCEGIYHYDCSGFVNEQVLGECLVLHYQDIYAHSSNPRPLAEDFYDYFKNTVLGPNYDPNDASTCTAENQYWKVFTNMDSLQKGDLICVKYDADWRIAENESNSGHLMIAWGAAQAMATNEYEIKVMDGASSGHTKDTRDFAPFVSRDGSGIGLGWMRFKSSTNVSNRPIQYLWKLTSPHYYRSYAAYYDSNDPPEERTHDRLEGIILARPK